MAEDRGGPTAVTEIERPDTHICGIYICLKMQLLPIWDASIRCRVVVSLSKQFTIAQPYNFYTFQSPQLPRSLNVPVYEVSLLPRR